MYSAYFIKCAAACIVSTILGSIRECKRSIRRGRGSRGQPSRPDRRDRLRLPRSGPAAAVGGEQAPGQQSHVLV